MFSAKKNFKLALLPLSVGAFSICAQALLVRDYLHCIEENELAIGLFFFFWFTWIVPGSFLGRLLIRFHPYTPHFTLLYIPAWCTGHWLTRNARFLGEIPQFEIFPFEQLILFSFLAPAGISILTGFLFIHLSKWWEEHYPAMSSKDAYSTHIVRSIYAIESLGAVLGGICSSLIIYFGFSHWWVFCVATSLIIISILINIENTLYKRAFILVCVAVVFAFTFFVERIETKHTFSKIADSYEYLGKTITQQNEYLFGKKDNRIQVYRNNKPGLTFFDSEYGLRLTIALLAQKEDIQHLLLIGEPFINCLPFICQIENIKKITWLLFDYELSDKLLHLIREYPNINLKKIELNPREPRIFLTNNPSTNFDAIFVYTSVPTSIVTNRYLTSDFFHLLKNHLTEKGIVGIRFAGGENFLSGELATLGTSVYYTFNKTFPTIAIKPGEETWLFGSTSYPVSELIPTLEKRLSSYEIKHDDINLKILRDLYPPDRISFQREKYEEITNRYDKELLENSDRNFRGFLFGLIFYLWQQGFTSIIDKVQPLQWIISFIFLSIPITFLIARWAYKIKISGNRIQTTTSLIPEILFAVIIIGVIGMSISLLLLIQFQYHFGSISTFIGLLSAMFMLGLGLSPLLFNITISKKQYNKSVWVLFFSIASAMILTTYIVFSPHTYFLTYLLIFFSWGFSLGFTLSWLLEPARHNVHTATLAVILESGDHIGAGFGALITPLLLLPFWGSIYSYVMISVILIITLINYPLLIRKEMCKTALWGRRLGYTLVPLLIITLVSSETYQRHMLRLPKDKFTEVAKSMAPNAELTIQKKLTSEGKEITYFIVEDKQGNNKTHSYIFSTRSLFKVMGYGGEIDIAVKVNSEGMIEDIKVIHSNETPDYLLRVENYFYLYQGRNIFNPESIASIDTISGATTTSDAIRRAVQHAGKEFANILKGIETEKIDIAFTQLQSNTSDAKLYIFISFIIISLFLRYYYNHYLRIIWLSIVVLVLGIWLNIQYGTYFISQLLNIEKLPFTLSISSLLVFGIPILVLFAGNVYCGYLCPFGALSELISHIPLRKQLISPSKKIWYLGRQTKYIIGFVLCLIFVTTRELKILTVDPLLSFFTFDLNSFITFFTIVVLLLSLLYNRFWCRVLCPTGAFLSLLQSHRLFSFLWQRTLPAFCDLGISNREEIDCIQCNRCFKHGEK